VLLHLPCGKERVMPVEAWLFPGIAALRLRPRSKACASPARTVTASLQSASMCSCSLALLFVPDILIGEIMRCPHDRFQIYSRDGYPPAGGTPHRHSATGSG